MGCVQLANIEHWLSNHSWSNHTWSNHSWSNHSCRSPNLRAKPEVRSHPSRHRRLLYLSHIRFFATLGPRRDGNGKAGRTVRRGCDIAAGSAAVARFDVILDSGTAGANGIDTRH